MVIFAGTPLRYRSITEQWGLPRTLQLFIVSDKAAHALAALGACNTAAVPIWTEDLPNTSGKRAFGLDPLVPAAIWAETKGPATSPQNRLAVREALVPARNEPLVPV
jgi:hypothetical protein